MLGENRPFQALGCVGLRHCLPGRGSTAKYRRSVAISITSSSSDYCS